MSLKLVFASLSLGISGAVAQNFWFSLYVSINNHHFSQLKKSSIHVAAIHTPRPVSTLQVPALPSLHRETPLETLRILDGLQLVARTG